MTTSNPREKQANTCRHALRHALLSTALVVGGCVPTQPPAVEPLPADPPCEREALPAASEPTSTTHEAWLFIPPWCESGSGGALHDLRPAEEAERRWQTSRTFVEGDLCILQGGTAHRVQKYDDEPAVPQEAVRSRVEVCPPALVHPHAIDFVGDDLQVTLRQVQMLEADFDGPATDLLPEPVPIPMQTPPSCETPLVVVEDVWTNGGGVFEVAIPRAQLARLGDADLHLRLRVTPQ